MNRKTAFQALLLAAAAIAAGAAAHAQQPSAEAKTTITPGYWDYKEKVLGVTVKSEQKCVAPAEVDKFFTGPCNKGYTCDYPVRDVANGRAKFEGTWLSRRGQTAHITAEGTYSARKFELDAHGTGTNGVPIAVTMTATWQSATCPEGAPH